jgi:LDH2 family malate/lactate/ureidoglycolate dehydrogenase
MVSEIPQDAIRIMPEPLRQWTTAVLVRLGLPQADAQHVAACLVQVDLRGVFSHGTQRLQSYVDQYSAGELNTHPEIKIVRDEPSVIVLDGDGGLGYLVAARATERLIAKVEETGLALAATRHHGHVGSLGIYARMALEKDLVTFGVAGGRQWQPPDRPGATVWDAMSSPPMCFAVPAADGPPFVLDMSANFFRNQDTLEEGMVKLALRPDMVGDVDYFKAEVQRISAASRALPPMAGQQSAEVAGSLEWQREGEWPHSGIPLGEKHREQLAEIARQMGVETTW